MENKNDTNNSDYKEIIRKNLHNTIGSGYVPELGKHKPGKVRDIHFTGEKVGDPIIMVASDRVSSFDHVLSRCIPFKGNVLNKISQWAFEQSKDIIPNAVKESPHPNVIVQSRCENLMIECVVRGYVWGSMAVAYEKGERKFCGITLPDGLIRYQKLDEPIFTPTTKSEHDEPMTFEEVEEQIGKERAKQVKDTAIKLFNRAHDLAEKAGMIFVDTKYEFGIGEDGKMYLIDEANTPDSSRFCTIDEYKKFDKIKEEMGSGKYKNVSEVIKQNPELKIKEMSKQFVRDVLIKKGFSYGSEGEPPELSDEDIIETAYRYIQLYETMTGNKFDFSGSAGSLVSSLRSEGLIKGGLVVIMAGSTSDDEHVDKIRKSVESYGIPCISRVCSAHKQPDKCKKILEHYNDSLEQVVIIAVAGGTDALSGTAAYHSIHPVISCPPDSKEYWSCIKNPPGSSNSLILKPKNVARHAAQILGYSVPDARIAINEQNKKKEKTLSEADEK